MKSASFIVCALLCVAAVGFMAFLPLEAVKGYGTIWLAVDTVLIAYFTIGYGLLSRWYSDEVGTHLLLFSLAITITFVNLLYLRLAKGATAAPEGLLVVTSFYVVLGFLFGWRAVIFTRAQIAARRKLKERN